MRNCILILVTLCFSASCKKSGSSGPETPIRIDSIFRRNLLGDDNLHSAIVPGESQAFSFKYDDNNNFKTRSGVFLTVVYSNGSIKGFSSDGYDTVIYNNNTIELTTKGGPAGYPVPPDRRVYTLSDGRIQIKIAYGYSLPLVNDTSLFYYSPAQTLNKVVESHGASFTVKTFSFNSAGNLDSVSGTTYSATDSTLLFTTIEKFGNYDNAKNPLKNFGIWDETFYRSLTTNNFRSYSYEKWYPGFTVPAETTNWQCNLHYDSQGLVDFTK